MPAVLRPPVRLRARSRRPLPAARPRRWRQKHRGPSLPRQPPFPLGNLDSALQFAPRAPHWIWTARERVVMWPGCWAAPAWGQAREGWGGWAGAGPALSSPSGQKVRATGLGVKVGAPAGKDPGTGDPGTAVAERGEPTRVSVGGQHAPPARVRRGTSAAVTFSAPWPCILGVSTVFQNIHGNVASDCLSSSVRLNQRPLCSFRSTQKQSGQKV